MLADRPAMSKYVKPNDEIWNWAVRKFAGEDVGSPVDWNSDDEDLEAGESHVPVGKDHAYIKIARMHKDLQETRPASFEELWAVAVFELHNVGNSNEWQKLDEMAEKGQLTREEYALGILTGEIRAAQCTRAFYVKVFLPWLHAKGIDTTNPREWYCASFGPAYHLPLRSANWKNVVHWPRYEANYDLLRAESEYGKENYELAKTFIDRVLKNKNALTKEYLRDAHFWMGHIDLSNTEYRQAIKEFSASIAVDASALESRLGRAMALVQNGSPSEAIEDLNWYLKKDTDSSTAFRWRGKAWQALQQFDKARADFDEAVRLDPSSTEPLRARALMFSEQGKHDDALRDLATAIRMQPDDANLYYSQGNARILSGDFSRAIDDFTKAIELAPQDAYAYTGRGDAWRNQGNTQKAFDDLDAAVRLDPGNSVVYLNRGLILLDMEKYEQALADFSKAIELDPDRLDGYGFRASLFLESKDAKFWRPAAAIQDATKICEVTKWQSPDALELLASAYAANDDFDNAIKWQTKAIALSDAADKPQRTKDLESYKVRQIDRSRAK